MRSDDYEAGRRNAVKACVAWLHAEAKSMADPHACMVLNNAAFHMGVQFKKQNPVVVEGPKP